MEKTCFIICPIGAEESPERKRADQLLKYVYSPVLSEFGYKPVRADLIPKSGIITSQIITMIVEADVVIADLTGGNPNVFYELAIRHAAHKPYIQVQERGANVPFDISSVRTIPIDFPDPDGIEKAKSDIRHQLQEFNQGFIPDNPVVIATKARALLDNPNLAQELVETISRIEGSGWHSLSDLGDKLEEIEEKLESMETGISLIESRLDEI